VLPGDHVDIILIRDFGGSPVTDILLQNIKVLGIDQDANQNRQQPGVVRAVTFEVTPTQSQKLVLAQQVGQLSLALRHTTNVNAIQPQTIGLRDLRIGEANLPEQPEPTSLVLQEGERPQIAEAPRKVEPKKPTTRVTTQRLSSKRDSLSAIRIVRALKATDYEVTPEKGAAAKANPGNAEPVNLLPKGQQSQLAVPNGNGAAVSSN
jgi:pilus assembly protein CpaB